MLKHTLLALFVALSCPLLHGQAVPTDQDTIILQRLDTSFAIDHVISEGETLYSLAKKYRTTLPAIHDINPSLMETELGISDTILMPLNNDFIALEQPADMTDHSMLVYHVETGVTLFAIAKKWLHTDMKYIKKLNGLESHVLSLDMPLTLGWFDQKMLSHKEPDPEDIKIAEMDAALIKANESSIQGHEATIEGGKAIWKASKSSGDKPYVLHRTAKMNSLVQIYNPMTGAKIHAKVVGRIPERNYDDNVMVVLTPYLADALKARDKAFFVKMKYTL